MATWVADQRYYLSEDGQVVGEDHPGRKVLLCAQGSRVLEQTCRRYGLGPYAGTPDEDSGTADATSTFTSEVQSVAVEDGRDDPDDLSGHRHYWRRDGTCRCGEVKPEGSE